MLVLDDIEGSAISEPPRTAGFNLLSASSGGVSVTSWDGQSLTQQRLAPGMHMIAHHDVDDARTARIETWLPEFEKLADSGERWREQWVELLAITAALPITDDRAIIRDNHVHGYPTASLLVCTAEMPVRSGEGAHVSLESAALAGPAVWNSPEFVKVE